MVDFHPCDPGFAENPYPIYARLRDEAPVYHHEELKFYALSRYADVAERIVMRRPSAVPKASR